MKIIKTYRLILYALLTIALATNFQKTQATEVEPKPLHRGVRVIDTIDAHSANDVEVLRSLCDVITTGKGAVNDDGRIVRFKDFDYAHKITDKEREILYRPLIDVPLRLKNIGNSMALEEFFSTHLTNLIGSHTAYQEALSKTTFSTNQKRLFYHHLTALAISVLAIGDFEKLNLNTDIKNLFEQRKEQISQSLSFKKALKSVTGLNGEIRQVKAYVKKQPESHLVLGVKNNEDRVNERFDPNWVFLNDEPHDPSKGRCLTVNFNDLSQLEKLASGLSGLFTSIVTDFAVFKFAEWDQRHLSYFKAMLKTGGEFIFHPEVYGSMIGCIDDEKAMRDFNGCKSIEDIIFALTKYNPDFNTSLSIRALKASKLQTLRYNYQALSVNSPILISLVSETGACKDEFDQFIEMHNLKEKKAYLQRGVLAFWIGNTFFERYPVLWNMPILEAVFDKVLYMKHSEYCEYKPYPFDTGNSFPLYIRCIKS